MVANLLIRYAGIHDRPVWFWLRQLRSCELRIPAKVTSDSGERDRFAHRSGAGAHFVNQVVTFSQVFSVFSS
jgi:hypothetical protein